MSRIGKKPIVIPPGVKVVNESGLVTVTGPKGTLQTRMHPLAQVEVRAGAAGEEVVITMEETKSKLGRSLWGTMRTLIDNMVIGVTQGYSVSLEVNGVGYKVALGGKGLKLELGYSHPIEFVLPEGIKAAVEKNIITLVGADKQMVGNTAAHIRKLRPPEPYKGKGIKRVDEVIRRKAGKAAKSA